MRTDSTQLQQRLDPVPYLPTPRLVGGDIPRDAFRLAGDILDAAHPGSEFSGARRSALAGGALYCATVVLYGPIVTQDHVGDAIGTTSVSIRGRIGDMARVAVEHVDVSAHTAGNASFVQNRLEHLANGGTVPSLPGFNDE